MKREKPNPEVEAQITKLRNLALEDEALPEQLKTAWRDYLSIKEQTIESPIDRISVSHVRTAAEVAGKGGQYEHNSTSLSAIDDLKKDFSLLGGTGLFGTFEENEKEKVKAFVEKMSDVLIRPR